MHAWNRAKLLWGYLRRKDVIHGLPVEYIVETTAKCNLYCPMCPRETHVQPNEDMTDAIFERLVRESGKTGEHMMLIGLGEPFLDPKIFERIKLPNADKSGCPFWPLARGPWHLLALLGRRRSLRHVVFGKKKIERFGEKVLDLPSSFGLNKAQGRFNLRGEIGADIDLPCPAHRQRLRLRLPLYRRRGLSRLRRGVSRRHFSGSLALDGFQYAWSRHFSHF